ncbi:MAG: ATP-binding protein [Casimicrobiaceae bacterium]
MSKLRNRVIGRVFHELGLIEQWGSGVQRMTAACRTRGSIRRYWRSSDSASG